MPVEETNFKICGVKSSYLDQVRSILTIQSLEVSGSKFCKHCNIFLSVGSNLGIA